MNPVTNIQHLSGLAWALWVTRDLAGPIQIDEMRKRLHCTNDELALLIEEGVANKIVAEEPDLHLTPGGEFLGSEIAKEIGAFSRRHERRRQDFKTYVPHRWYPDA